MTSYRCILADPPWAERGGGRIKRGADRHYPVMAASRILDVLRRDSPLGAQLGGPEPFHLWLWATSNHLHDAFWLLRELGLRFVTDWVWTKDRIGLGQYRRSRHELLLLAVHGALPRPARPWPDSVIAAPRTAHSRKPEAAFQVVEHVSPGPRLELFARARRPGWECWGDEVGDTR